MKAINRTIWMIWLVFGLTAVAGAQDTATNTGTVEVLSVDRFDKLIQETKNPQLIDVRTDAEVAEGMIPGAQQINISTPEVFSRKVEGLDKDRPVLIYCRSGRRSSVAAKDLHDRGFKEVYDLGGGILSWQKEGKELVKPNTNE